MNGGKHRPGPQRPDALRRLRETLVPACRRQAHSLPAARAMALRVPDRLPDAYRRARSGGAVDLGEHDLRRIGAGQPGA